MLSPRQIFEDNVRPADLLLKVFRLLEHDALNTEEDLLRSLRQLANAEKDESILVISNGIFLGLIRELAEISPASIKRSALCNLLRQAVVTASTAMETYLPSLLRNNLPEVIRLRGRDFVPKTDEDIKNQFKSLTFALDEVARILVDPDPLFVANKLISSLSFNYLSGKRGIHVTGVLLALDNPWEQIAQQLGREEDDLKKTLDATVKRRNDIVHRADRSQDDPAGPAQDIGFPWSKHAVETIRVVCLALDDLVANRLKELKQQAAASQPQVSA
ncbi:MAG TPA: HEPN domain-containing protein [Candidatus Acidoferrales bacterium]|nr:HEPN domain-containing protein [Candidatus Acidoferrales bacterium]